MPRLGSRASIIVLAISVLAISVLAISASAEAQPEFSYLAPTTSIPIGTTQETSSFTVDFEIVQTSGALAGTLGFSMGVMHDPDVLSVDSVEAASAIVDPTFFAPQMFQDILFADGWTVLVVYTVLGSVLVEFPTPTPVIQVQYTAGEETPLEPGLSSPLTWTETLGMPPQVNVVVVAGVAIPAEVVDGSVSFEAMSFIRGDMNGDGVLDIADVFTAEDYLFLAGPTPSCLAALDTNSDSTIDIADIISLLDYLFVGGAAPGAPFPACRPEPAGAGVGCEEYACP